MRPPADASFRARYSGYSRRSPARSRPSSSAWPRVAGSTSSPSPRRAAWTRRFSSASPRPKSARPGSRKGTASAGSKPPSPAAPRRSARRPRPRSAAAPGRRRGCWPPRPAPAGAPRPLPPAGTGRRRRQPGHQVHGYSFKRETSKGGGQSFLADVSFSCPPIAEQQSPVLEVCSQPVKQSNSIGYESTRKKIDPILLRQKSIAFAVAHKTFQESEIPVSEVV